MKNVIFWFVTICFSPCFIFPFSVCADEKNNVQKGHQYYREAFVGYHTLPGFLLNFEADVYPKNGLMGRIEGVRAGYLFNNKYSLGLAFFHANVNGTGPWGNKKDAVSQGVEGVATGTVDFDILGANIEGTRRFYLLKNLALLCHLGLGVAYGDIQFNGVFNGHAIQNASFEIHEPAKAHYHRIIPVVGLGVGLEWSITREFFLVVGSYLNTGLGAEASLAYHFDVL